MERWRDGEMERRRDGEMERWRDEEMEKSNLFFSDHIAIELDPLSKCEDVWRSVKTN